MNNMNDKINKFFNHLRKRDFFKGAGIVIWKIEEGRKYVLLSERNCGYGTGYYSNTGGHCDEADLENSKWIYINTAVRETGEETCIIPQYHRSDSIQIKHQSLEKARKFFLENPDFIIRKKPIRNLNLYCYHHVTYAIQAKGKMAKEKWYQESYESVKGTMKWYSIDVLPKKLLIACRLNILYVWFAKDRNKQ